jgi:CRISPR-associated protein Csm2
MESIKESNYVNKAEEVIGIIKTEGIRGDRVDSRIVLSTSQIRNLLSMTADMYSQAQNDPNPDLSEDLKKKVQYLRVAIVYAAGREEAVKKFVEKTKLLDVVKEIKSRDDLILFCRYMEALVAFRKFHIKGDK